MLLLCDATMGGGDSDAVVYLHGDLDFTIAEAQCLPNMDVFTQRVRRCLNAFDSCKPPVPPKRKVTPHRHKMVTCDPYVTVCLAGATIARTRVIPNSQDPVWDEHFVTPVAHPVTHVEFQVKDNDVFGAELIGVASISAERIKSGELIDDWFSIIGPFGKPPKPNASIRLQIQFTSCDDAERKDKSFDGEELFCLRDSYFPVRGGGNVTLYQDAHVVEGQLPEIELGGGGGGEEEEGVKCNFYKQRGCWEDICHAILEAHHLVYIVGWSIYDKVKLVREPNAPLPNGGDLTLGELLKYKSEEGVRVLLLVWDDKTSHNKFFIKTEGVMETHDEDTRKFFKHSSVHCVLSPRYASTKLSIIKQQVVGTLYTHHQKCVIVDTQAQGNYRKISAFIGGLDLCDGRYDTPEHRLFRDLDTVFENDFHNPTFSSGTKAPREPWHDLHCKIDGPAAYDVLTNFEQRWRKATKWSELGRRFKRISHWHEDALLKIERISWILSPSSELPTDDPALWVSEEEDPENWHVQVFRSIDSGSLRGFPKDVQEAELQNLVCAKNLVIDRSVQKAYIRAIRSAKNFIYIENQYFLGSSYAWPSNKDAGADHLIPMELALKIANKIRANERFSVYVVIPMWPEGHPNSVAVQQILYWQGQTMQMMYDIIAKELKSSEVENGHPLDYLNFYCLGNREECPEEVSTSGICHSSNAHSVSASYRYGRFMIYVHAKGMIVDDEYVILGSANINQRSMAGSRDTEIAMGAYQPHHTWTNKNRHPRGQVYGYRMSLWAEHTAMIDDEFMEPESLACMQSVNKLAEDNWRKYTSDDFSPLQGHLLKYPIKVDANGKVSPLPRHEHFPDVGGKVLGSLANLPTALTT
ncbi:phospholipase D delta-like isoform X2 [Cynara cardunculus var. scolymus]|uniref:phospholipase D delta-like isoform X2 n=1 Tax=Cynara cardunculus var. scolymus TaxID=59895 RepID=UPI000D623095|nr:phospholipase D delta-like isoform X2 [Cynara cardunculus var. scolymus]